MRNVTVSKVLSGALFLGAGAFLLVYLVIAIARVSYAFELEWMEGAMVDHVRRILDGEAIYAPPALDFTPFSYAPVYFYLSAVLAKVMGLGFLPLRLVSLLSSLGSFVILFALVRRETGEKGAAFLAACLFAASFKIGGSFLDVARVDSLFTFMTLATLYAIRVARTPATALATGALFAVLVFTKQVALLFFPPIALYFLLCERRLLLPFVGAFAVLAGSIRWLLDFLTDGWAGYYLFSFHAGRTIQRRGLEQFLTEDLVLLDYALLLGAFFLVSRFTWRRDVRTGLFYTLAAAGVVGACGISRSLSLGAFTNVLIPMHAVIALLFGLGFAEVRRCTEQAAATDVRWRALAWLPAVLCILQFGRLAYDPRYQVPSAADRAAGEALVARMRSIEGEVFLPDHGHLVSLAGKSPHVHTVAIFDTLANDRTRPYMEDALREGIRGRVFGAIFLSDALSARFGWIEDEIRQHYALLDGPVFEDPRAFMPVTGVRLRPERIYERVETPSR